MLDKELYMLEIIQYEDEGFCGVPTVTGVKRFSLIKDVEEMKHKIVEVLMEQPEFLDGKTVYSPVAIYNTDEEYLGVDVYSTDSDGVLHNILSVYGEFANDGTEYIIDFSELGAKNSRLVFSDFDEDERVFGKAEWQS